MEQKETIKISIIVPVYNTEKYLKDCIDSILNQTYQNIELILINDESTDSSSSICREYAKHDNRIIFLQQMNSGAGVARNRGIKTATGTYIMFVDSDDIIDKTMLEKMVDRIQNPPEQGIVVCKVCKFYETRRRENIIENIKSFSVANEIELYNKYYFPLISSKINFFSVRALYPRKLIIESCAEFGLCTFSEDLIFLLRACKNVKWIELVDEYLYFWRRHSQSLTAQRYRKNFLSDSTVFFTQFEKTIKTLQFSDTLKSNLIEYTRYRLQNELIYNACGINDYKNECIKILESPLCKEANPTYYKWWFKQQSKGNKLITFLIQKRLFNIIYIARKVIKI